MQQNNRASNARYLGQVNGGYPDTYSSVNDPITEDQYQPMPPLFVEETPKKPNPDELSGQDCASQPTEYDPS
jgi:hypothetical protein